MRITDLPELSAADLALDDVVVVDHDTGNGIETRQMKVANLLDKLYPVGCIYQSANSTSPASFLGGTWEQIKDRFILAAGDTYAAGSTGGEAEVCLTNSDQNAPHAHVETKVGADGTAIYIVFPDVSGPDDGDVFGVAQTTWHTSKKALTTTQSGGSKPHNNMPPYLTVYIWQRIA